MDLYFKFSTSDTHKTRPNSKELTLARITNQYEGGALVPLRFMLWTLFEGFHHHPFQI